MVANAVELTAEQAWFVADASGAGTLPWVLAVTPPYSDSAARAAVEARLSAELTQLGVLTAPGVVDPAVRQWIRATCRPRRWLELRFVRGSGHMLRGHIGHRSRPAGDIGHRSRSAGDIGPRSEQTVVALRSDGLVTLTAVDVDHPRALVPILTAGLARRPPARFDEFTIPARVGARADEQLRNGAALPDVLEFLGIPPAARAVVTAAYATDRSYVEIVAGEQRDAHRVGTDVGVSVVDTHQGRVLVHPTKAYDGEWVSTFAPGTPLAIATAVERLTATLPGGAWFPDLHLTCDFDSDHRTEHPQCQTATQPVLHR